MHVVLCRGEGGLQSCVLTRNIQHLLKLLKNGVNVNSVNKFNETALFVASYFGETNIICLLLEHGADVNSKNVDGNTPLHAAAYNGDRNSMRILTSAGADGSIPNNHGLTAIDVFERSQNHRPGKDFTRLLRQPEQSSEKTSLLERLKCHKFAKRHLRHAPYKLITTDYGRFLCLQNHPRKYMKSIPVIDSKELLRNSLCVDVNEEVLYASTESKRWRGTSVNIRRVTTDYDWRGQLEARLRTVFDNSIVRELKVISRLQHPNILNLLAVMLLDPITSLELVDPTQLALVYERPSLGSLHHWTQVKLEDVPVLSAFTICRQVAEALMFLHSFGMVHCNVTPYAIHLFSLDSAKLGNFEYAVEPSELTTSDRCEPLSTSLGPSSPNISGVASPTLPTKTDECIPYFMLYECALHLPASHLANWLPPELFTMSTSKFDKSQGSTCLRGPVTMKRPCFASDVYSLAKVLESLIPNLDHGSPDVSLEYAGYVAPITNARVVLAAALQPRPEERLPLKQFHRLLIHLFWTEYEQMKSPKPQLKATIPCPLRLCDHRTPGHRSVQQSSSTITTTLASTGMGIPQYPSPKTTGGMSEQESSELRCPRHITFRRRRRLQVELTGQPEQGSPDSNTSMLASGNVPAACLMNYPSPGSPWKCGTLLSSDTSPSSGFYKTAKTFAVKSSSTSEPEWSSVSDRLPANSTTKNLPVKPEIALATQEPIVSPPCSSGKQSGEPLAKKSLEKQSSTKLTRFYPFVNEWLKRRKFGDPKSENLITDLSFTTCSSGKTPLPVQSQRSPSLPKLSLMSLLKSPQTVFKRSKSVKLTRADYLELAAVPLVPEGVEVPPNLVPWRSPSVCHHSVGKLSRSNTMPCRKVWHLSPCTPVVTSIISRSKLHHSPLKTVEVRDKRDVTPVKPASHQTHLTPVAVDYSEVTGKPDLIRSSSHLSRHSRRYTDRRAPPVNSSVEAAEFREETLQSLHRNHSCSFLNIKRNPLVMLKSVSTQTEEELLKQMSAFPCVPERTKAELSTIILPNNFRMTNDSSPAGDMNLNLQQNLRADSMFMRERLFSSSNSTPTQPKQFNRVKRMVEMFEYHLSPMQPTVREPSARLGRTYTPRLYMEKADEALSKVKVSRCVADAACCSGRMKPNKHPEVLSVKPFSNSPPDARHTYLTADDLPPTTTGDLEPSPPDYQSRILRRVCSQPFPLHQYATHITGIRPFGSWPRLHFPLPRLCEAMPNDNEQSANPEKLCENSLPGNQLQSQSRLTSRATSSSVLSGESVKVQYEQKTHCIPTQEFCYDSKAKLDTSSASDFELPPPLHQPTYLDFFEGSPISGSLNSLPPPPSSESVVEIEPSKTLQPICTNGEGEYVNFLTIPLTGSAIRNDQSSWILSPRAPFLNTLHGMNQSWRKLGQFKDPCNPLGNVLRGEYMSADSSRVNTHTLEDKENEVPHPDVPPPELPPPVGHSKTSRSNSQSSYLHWGLL
ncbi:hypothetical protein CRM22_003728 [Opisthorchis felineus]|uniref:Protein kinase domain-containing protein n=1 Tax=Opisthorchis felineus TaxID=147828 RepID=A0A4V3SFS2_OPIFE|nr:hypothetical protein CRM22_003728 [Opisthorchis felineus]TGZ69466.1 hypothetical protein CRM22_003728 [Opisthorchis felineus]